MHLRMDRVIKAPPEGVFDYLADCRNEMEWNHAIRSIHLLTPEPVGRGSRFTGEYAQVGQAAFQIVEYERPTHIRFQGAFSSLDFDMVASLNPTPGGATRLLLETDFEPRGVMRLLLPLLGGRMRREYESRGEALGRILEQRASVSVQ
jgi:uncharacterized protein YndB with AHSA1/START domain